MAAERWDASDLDAALEDLYDHYDDWQLAAVGAGIDADGVTRGTAWIQRNAVPHAGLVRWRDSMEYPAMITIKEYGKPDPGEGPDVETER